MLPSADELNDLKSQYDVLMIECASPLNKLVRVNIMARVSYEAFADISWEARRSYTLLQNGDPIHGFEVCMLVLSDHVRI